MSVAASLDEKAKDYETLATFHAERAPVDPEHRFSALVFLAVALCLREVAATLDEEMAA